VTARFTSCCGAARFWRAQGLDFDHCGLRVAPSSRRRLRPLRHGLPWRLAPPASKSESIRLQTPLNGLSERRHRSGPKPDAGSCTSLGARIDSVDDSRAYPTCPGRKSMCALSLTCTCEQKPLRAIPFPEDWLRMIMGVAASQGCVELSLLIKVSPGRVDQRARG
jgi:hypothetical protein